MVAKLCFGSVPLEVGESDSVCRQRFAHNRCAKVVGESIAMENLSLSEFAPSNGGGGRISFFIASNRDIVPNFHDGWLVGIFSFTSQ